MLINVQNRLQYQNSLFSFWVPFNYIKKIPGFYIYMLTIKRFTQINGTQANLSLVCAKYKLNPPTFYRAKKLKLFKRGPVGIDYNRFKKLD